MDENKREGESEREGFASMPIRPQGEGVEMNNPSVQAPSAPPQKKHMGVFKKVFLGIFGFICLLGILRVGILNFFPANSQTQVVKKATRAAGWLAYTNKTHHYSVSYPDNLKVSETPYSVIFQEKSEQAGVIGFPAIYVSVIPKGFETRKEVYNFMPESEIEKIYAMNDNAQLHTDIAPDAQYGVFTRLAAIPVGGVEGVMLQNTNVWQGEGFVNRRVVVRRENTTYIIGSYFKNQEELEVFRRFIESFVFVN